MAFDSKWKTGSLASEPVEPDQQEVPGLDAIAGESGPRSPEDAVKALGPTAPAPPPGSPEPVRETRRARGRPKGWRKPVGPPGQAPSANTVPVAPALPSLDRLNKTELRAIVVQLQGQVATLAPGAIPPEKLRLAKETVVGIVSLLDYLYEKKLDAPELVATKEERDLIGDAAAKPVVPLLEKLGDMAEWVQLSAVLLAVYLPKAKAYMERDMSRDDLRRRKEVIIPASEPQPSSATLSGGIIP